MVTIKSPNKDYTGVSASVAFAAGVGYTDNPKLIAWFKDHGYTVEDEPVDLPENDPPKVEKPKNPKKPSGSAKKKTEGSDSPDGNKEDSEEPDTPDGDGEGDEETTEETEGE